MANMNYCAFENTSKDLSQAYDKLSECDFSELNSYELRGAISIIKTAMNIVEFHSEDLETLQKLLKDYKD